MESSEDDAGAATNASRRASAREKDVGGGEDGGASDGMPPELADAGAASETASMSEEAFDADSVPSPSAQDINTSTEAILDMIDEIVDGPDATRRRSHTPPDGDTVSTAPAEGPTEPPPPSDTGSETPSSSPPATVGSAQSETVPLGSASELPPANEPQNVAPISDSNEGKVSPECLNNTNEGCISALPTGVGPPTESLPDKLDYSAQEDTTKSNLLPVEVDTRPETQENIPISSSLCQEVAPVSDTSECVPVVVDVCEPCPEVLPTGENIESVPKETESTEQAPTPSPSVVQSDNTSTIETSPEVPNELSPQSSSLQLTRHTESPQASSSVTSNDAAESTSEEAAILSKPEEPSNLSPSVPSSSVTEPVQIVSDSSENQICERTIKCVTSSDNRDNVTVESAESTSESLCTSVREGRASPGEPVTRSPLRRRLVRPAPSDRRPDSTVSSSVDSPNVHVDTTEQTTSESVTKDVSSSSDAVTSVYCNIKPEEIRVSEISVCKAETSMSPPKKIKLVRQKSTASVPQRDSAPLVSISGESEQCQSTSSECTPTPQNTASSSSSGSQIAQPEDIAPHVSNKCVTNDAISHLQETSSKNSDKTSPEQESNLQNSDSLSQPIALIENQEASKDDQEKKVPPIKLNLSGSIETASSDSKSEKLEQDVAGSSTALQDTPDCAKQVPKLTIKLSSKQSEEAKSPIPKLTIKPIRPPPVNDNSKRDVNDQKPSITKLNIKPIPKPAEKVNDIHRKSSSSEISESESSENDESNSMSDPASNSDQGPEVVPKVTIKVGKPGTESEGKFYTEQNAPKLLIKGLQQCENEDHESKSKLKLIISQPEEKQPEKIPKLTIKTVCKSEGQPLSPKLTIKPIRPPESSFSESTENPPIPKMKITAESLSNVEVKENAHIPKITIKPVVKTDAESASKTPKKSAVLCDSPEHIPVVSKLNIKPIMKPLECEMNNLEDRVPVVSKLHIKPIIKPTDSGETSESSEEGQIPVVSKLNIKPIIKPTETNELAQSFENIPVVSKLNIKPILKPPESGASESIDEKVPVVSKLNIKPILKPKSNQVESSIEDVPKVTKLNIKPLRNPEEKSSEEKDCDVKNADSEDSIPVVMKLNIKPIVKPVDEDASKDSENQSSETGNSSDDNADHIPVVTKLNIKPIVKPNEQEHDSPKANVCHEESFPVVTKLNIKPLVKPDESKSPSSPKRITKLNIKPVVNPDEIEQQKLKNEGEDLTVKNPPLLMKINIKNVGDATNDCFISDSKKLNSIDEHKHLVNNVEENVPKVTKLNIRPIVEPDLDQTKGTSADTSSVVVNCIQSSSQSHQKELSKQNCVPDLHEEAKLNKHAEKSKIVDEKIELHSNSGNITEASKPNENVDDSSAKSKVNQSQSKQSAHHNCTLLKKLLETKKDGLDKRLEDSKITVNHTPAIKTEITLLKEALNSEQQNTLKVNSELHKNEERKDLRQNEVNDVCASEKVTSKQSSPENICKDSAEKVIEPLEISISDKLTNQSSGQDSPRIILKINKTDHGASAKIITEERPSTPQQNAVTENTQQHVIEKQSQKRVVNSRKKPLPETPEVHVGKRLRSSRIVEEKTPIAKKNAGKRPPSTETSPVQNKEPELSMLSSIAKKNAGKRPPSTETSPVQNKEPELSMLSSIAKKNAGKRPPSTETSPVQNKEPELSMLSSIAKKNAGKRPPSTETSPVQNKEPELSMLESKRLKLGQLLSNKSLTITTIPAKAASVSPTKPSLVIKPTPEKTVNHSLLNNENCSKNGNSKLANILSNLQVKQAQALAFNEIKRTESISITPELESNTSTGSSDVVEVVVPIENDMTTIVINDNSESRDLTAPAEELSQDPLEVAEKPVEEPSPSPVPLTTPQPRKRGRPRKLPLSEPAKQAPVVLPVPALEERPQRSLRLSRDRPTPTILAKPRGRGRGRGARRADPPPREEPVVDTSNKFYIDEKPVEDIDPTSSRIKLPRMTEALDKLPSTPLSSRRRSSSTSTSTSELRFDSEPKVVLNIMPKLEEALAKAPETPGRGGRGGRGKRGGGRGQTPVRTPRSGRGRGRGGGRGAQYMKETMGIYGRVCGPATTTVQLFEEETCMMDDNATPAKSVNFIDEDSQSSVMSSTNDSSRMKKSKFADLFDSNKIWTAADVKEYMWPPPETPGVEHQVMMIQEQVAMFLGVKSFKRRYPELKRRAVAAEERDYVLSKGLVTEALCDLGITAVDASEVLDIMLSDYPHKYEEYRQHQRDKQRESEATAASEEPDENKDQKVDRIEMKVEVKPVEAKPEPPKVDLEKTRQEALAAAIASASEFNARMNALRLPAYADLQTHTVHKRRAPPTSAPTHVRPPAGLYPHALLPGQYQHSYRTYTPEQLRYFPLNTVVSAPPRPPSPLPSSESEGDWSSSSGEDSDTRHQPKRKKLTKTKRSSQAESSIKEEPKDDEKVELCRVCKLRLEANRKYTHERFLVCANCKANLHPSCCSLPADTIRKAREYAWQCAACKSCCACHNPHDDSKMLFCDLCDRGFHIYCVGLDKVPQGRWHCVECAVCKSCGAKEPTGPAPPAPAPGTPAPSTPAAGGASGASGAGGAEEATWHHQTKRGPGGHKVYSHSLCTPCARAYRIGRYCPLCDRSFIGPKGTMQLVICKLCDRQHHQECVKQTVSLLNVLDYTCAECRRGGITSRSAAARLAPRTIATLFMAKRRFNKYAHRQYMQSRLKKEESTTETDAEESREVAEPAVVAADDASDASDVADVADVSDPLEGAEPHGAAEPLDQESEAVDETEAAVAALQMDFGD